jgi:hypothetical protein
MSASVMPLQGICYHRAKDAGIATAKLPIAQHIKLQTSVVSKEVSWSNLLVKVMHVDALCLQQC